MCFKGVLFFLNTFARGLNSLPGTPRAFRTPKSLNEPLPQVSRRTAGERSFLSIPSLPWSAQEKLFSVVFKRCYAIFNLAKVALLLGLFSQFHTGRFWEVFGMCELHLCTFSLALRNFFLRVPNTFRRQLRHPLDLPARLASSLWPPLAKFLCFFAACSWDRSKWEELAWVRHSSKWEELDKFKWIEAKCRE